MRNYPQWMLFKTEQRGDRLEKFPVSPHTGEVVDAHDPRHWVTYEVAQAALSGRVGGAQGITFSFTEPDPFFFIDIDHCLQADGQWDPNALGVVAAFPGAEVEVSVSGTGLHIFGIGVPIPGYKVKARDGSFDIYLAKRFVAYTGNGTGDATQWDHSAALQATQAARFDMRPAGVESAEWTTEPDPEWAGPPDDEALIAQMLRSQSVRAMFGDSISTRDLWEANEAKLSARWPDPQRTYDASSADASLLSHLAFWTGKDCERMDRMFRLSGLMRDKWDDRPDYRERSILGAVAQCIAVLKSGQNQSEPVAPVPASEGTDEEPEIVAGLQKMGIHGQIEHFRGCVYIRSIHKVLVPDGGLLKPMQFKSTYGGYIFAMDNLGDKETKDAFEALTESQGLRHVWAHGPTFRPELPAGKIVKEEGHRLVNTYVKPDIRLVDGDPAPFLDHLRKLLPIDNDREILLSWMAACVKFPGFKLQWCPVVQGVEGNGKSMLIDVMTYAMGSRYTHIPNPDDLISNGSKFTAWIENKTFIGVNEIRVKTIDAADKLKQFITDRRMEIQGKGADQVTGDNRANFFMCSNHKDAVRKTEKDRRYAVFYCAQQDRKDLQSDRMLGSYFPNLWEWLRADGFAIIAHYLQNFEIPHALNPVTNLINAPHTSSTVEAIEASRGSIEQEVQERIDRGEYGFSGGWVSSLILDRVLDQLRVGRVINRSNRKAMMQELGYLQHPGLKDGRSLAVPSEGGKPRLYIKEGHPACMLNNSRLITDAYIKAQETVEPDNSEAISMFNNQPGV